MGKLNCLEAALLKWDEVGGEILYDGNHCIHHKEGKYYSRNTPSNTPGNYINLKEYHTLDVWLKSYRFKPKYELLLTEYLNNVIKINKGLFKIKIPIFYYELIIITSTVVDEDVKEYLLENKINVEGFEMLYEHINSYSLVDSAIMYSKVDSPVSVLYVRPHTSTEELVNTVSHEAFHVLKHLTDEKGIIYSEDSEETYAYLQGYITAEIYKILTKNPL